MSSPESSLPEAWVERIWAAMRATYGATFDRQWECPAGADPVAHVEAMKTHWGRELSRFQQNPDAIRYGLENLPEYPPNLVEFRTLCNRRPEVATRRLPPPVNRHSEASAQGIAAMRHLASTFGKAKANPREWAHRLSDREQRNGRLSLTPFQREAWREALHQPAEPIDNANFGETL